MQPHRSLFHSLLSAALFGILTGGNAAPARAAVLALDWSHLSAAYQSGAAASTTPQTFTIGSMTATTVFSSDTTHFYQSTPAVGTYGTGTGQSTAYATGGLTNGELAMQIGVDFTDNTTQSVKFTINFSQAVYGVTFTIFDVDAGSSSAAYVDQVRNIFGVNGATTVLPTLTSTSATPTNLVYPGNGITSSDPTILNAATGTSTNAQTADGGNVKVSFSNQTAITSISFIYSNNQALSGGGLTTAPANSGIQIIGLGNVAWATTAGENVPEPGTLATVGLGLAGMSAVVLRRRRRKA